MTRAIPFTKAKLRRAIEAAREAGLRVKGIAPDGTLITEAPKPLLSRETALEYCHCTPAQFDLFVGYSFLPRPKGDGWDTRELDSALGRMDVREKENFDKQVYFIRAQRYIKIGFSGSADLRIFDLQASSPFKLELLGTLVGNERTERRLHELFRPWHVRREWFRKTPLLLAYIEWIGATK